jgi:F-type H+-transporting ATPase subunit a
MVIGEGGRKYIPMFSAIFLFVLANNLMGIIPGMTPATENINTTFAMGLFTFLAYNMYGIKENGIGYLQHFLGPIIWLAPIMLPIELISHMVRPFSLGLRLANVMMGDHTVVGIFLGLGPGVVLPIPFYLLGIFVCFVQAFVFTLLSMVYVAMATAHDH